MTQTQIMQEVKVAQEIIDLVVPGKVRVEAEWCDESRAYYMVGHYVHYMNYAGEITPVDFKKTEKVDRYYCTNIFAYFFQQRAAYMNATPREQMNHVGHPATFKAA